MTWLVFGVSCLLVLAGAVSIISGAPIIQLERGWAEVIAGTVALSSGGVVFALAGILMRLEAIRDTLGARAMPLAVETIPVSAPPNALDKVEALPPVPPAGGETATAPPRTRSGAPPQQDTEQVAPPVDEGTTQGLWKRVKRPGDELPDAERLSQHGFPDRIASDDIAAEAPTEATPVLVPAHAVPEVALSIPEPMPVAEASPQETPPARDAGQIGWLERSLFKGRTARSTTDAPARAEPALDTRSFERLVGRAEPSLSPAEASAPRVSASEPNFAAEPAPTPDLASEHHEGATVIGRYQAGVASYVMYSDGTIEVETEGGDMHRFGSMDELKAYIAKQDTPVA